MLTKDELLANLKSEMDLYKDAPGGSPIVEAKLRYNSKTRRADITLKFGKESYSKSHLDDVYLAPPEKPGDLEQLKKELRDIGYTKLELLYVFDL